MPYVPHTEDDIKAMLDAIGVADVEALFAEIPAELRSELQSIPAGMNEMDMMQHMQARQANNQNGQCFLGAGAYEHYIPAAVWQLTTRGEFLTAYTPYQAEASQGNLQLIYEFQSMMANLLAMQASNASLYDGGSSLAEAVLMAIRCQKKRPRKVLVAGSLNPRYWETLTTIVTQQGIACEQLAYDPATGRVDASALLARDDFAALVIPQPNYLGQLESVDALTDWAHQQQAFAIACVNPLAMALLKPPGHWGEQGADIACGEGQPLGIPLASGGPYFGFMCCRASLVRQMPGRIVGRTEDLDGKPGFALTLQAREQHIRRSKATSNICTNQGLLVTAATIYLALMGAHGLRSVAALCHQRSVELAQELSAIDGVEIVYGAPFFHEIVCRTPYSAATVLAAMAARGLQAGVSLVDDFGELEQAFLICVTETKSSDDIKHYAQSLADVLKGL